jgi:hypothetical protein
MLPKMKILIMRRKTLMHSEDQGFNVWWGNCEDGYVLVAENVLHNAGWRIMTDWVAVNAPNLGYYYRGTVREDGTMWYDYGSHHNFFEFRPI